MMMNSQKRRVPGRIVRQETPPTPKNETKPPCGFSWTEAILAEGSSTVGSSNNISEKKILDDTTSVSSLSSYQEEHFDAIDLSLEEEEQNILTIHEFEDVDLSRKEEDENLGPNIVSEDMLTRIPLPAGDIGLAFQGSPPKVQLVTKDSPVPEVPVGCVVTALNLTQDQVIGDLTTPSLVTALYESRRSENRTLVVLATPGVVLPAPYEAKASKIRSETCFSRIRTLVGLSNNSFSLPTPAF